MTIDDLPFPARRSFRKRLLDYFFTHPEARLYLREIAAKIGADPANLSRALGRFEKEGIFVSEKEGLQKYFSLRKSYPLYAELKSIVQKTLRGRGGERGARGAAVYIVAGPKGAGKTTFAREFLPEYVQCRQFVNADLIAGGLSPFSPEALAIQAGKLLLGQIRNLAGKGIDFGFETTLAGKVYQKLFPDLRSKGYVLRLFFLWIPSVQLALSRIQDRVRRGGHSIPEPVVERRFERGIQNLFKIYRPLVDSWALFDNSGSFPHVVASEDSRGLKVIDSELFDRIKKQAGVKIL